MLQKVFRTADPSPTPTPDTVRVVLPEARKLRKIRAASNLTQEQVGAAIGVSGYAVSSWEMGSCVPGKLNLQKLRDYIAKHDAAAPAPAASPQQLKLAPSTDEPPAMQQHVIHRTDKPALRFTGVEVGSEDFGIAYPNSRQTPLHEGVWTVYRTKGGNAVVAIKRGANTVDRWVWHGPQTELHRLFEREVGNKNPSIIRWLATLGFTVYEDIA